MSFITDISTAVPDHVFNQEQFLDVYQSFTSDETLKRKAAFIVHKSTIEQRYSVINDLQSLISKPIEETMAVYEKEGLKLSMQAIAGLQKLKGQEESFTDIITVSCTGMSAPGLEISLIKELGLNKSINRYAINFMGCYAGITALKLADNICNQPNRKVLIVSTELCTLHFQNNFSNDYLLSNALFSDGSAAVVVSSQEEENSLGIDGFNALVQDHTSDHMSWNISSNGFLMRLSPEVPEDIKPLFSNDHLFRNKAFRKDNWAIHPGGVQIINAIEQSAGLSATQTSISRDVLKDYGNMSSATILFILERFLSAKDQRINKLQKIQACALGPGLSYEGMQLYYA